MKRFFTPFAVASVLAGLVGNPKAEAQVRSEADLFGAPEKDEKKSAADDSSPAKAAPKDETPRSKEPANAFADSELIDKLQIGGRLELRASASKVDDQRFQLSPYAQDKTADIYFDTRPNKDTRAFFRLRFQENNSKFPTDDKVATTTEKSGVSSIQNSIDELWFKWDVADTLFVTAGKQHVKWGRGRFWNPTDFTAREARDPFSLFDRRLGQEMIKLHLPLEKAGHNLYAIVQLDDTARNDDVALALRGEFAIGRSGETAISLQTKRGKPLRLGIDFGIGLGNFDVNLEAAWLTRDAGPRFEGDLDLQKAVFPSIVYDDKKIYNQSVANIEYVWKYNDDDNMTLGLEGFSNEAGYDSRILEFYALLQNRAQVLYSGKQYIATYARLTAPGNWDDSSFLINAVQNLSDRTALLRFTATYTFYKQITVETYVSHCLGEYGELCFRVPDTIIQGMTTLSPDLQKRLVALPKKTTRSILGGSLSMNF